MYNLYETIYALCHERNITPGGLCGQLGFRRSILSDLKSGRKKTLDTTTLVKIADYFDVSVGYLLGFEQEKTHTPNQKDELTLHDNIDKLLKARGITGYKLCNDLGMSRSFMTELRKGRVKGTNAETAQRIADYFGISVERLLGSEQEKTPTPNQKDELTFDDFTYAMYEEGKELTEESKRKLIEMAQFFKQHQEKENT